MAVNWTEQQLEAIEARGGNILVAAAAGSGKTAVLVERIIRIITDAENPVSVDRLLVLTFTEAAAAEMKRKISDAIDKKLEENPDDGRLREQSVKVGSASISTIHSFCSRIISNNSYLTSLPSDFALIDVTENEVLRAKAVDAVLESYYSHIDTKPAFKELVMGWGGIKGDDDLRKVVTKLHDFSRSLAYPKKWLRNAHLSCYTHIKNGGALETSAWAELIRRQLYNYAVSVSNGLRIIWDIVDNEVPSDHKYYPFYYDLMNTFCSALEKIDISEADSTEKLRSLIESFKIGSAPNRDSLDTALIGRINYIRDKIVKIDLARASALLSASDGENLSRISRCAPVVRTLCSIVRQVECVHQKYKTEKSVIDFSDLEHGLLRLICNERGEETPLCLKLREHYHEILLDEFQDTNILQFEIFSHLSRKEGNLFMVGDVKQCIYKFRNADPSIFTRLYKSYEKGDGGRLIRLFKNFRSRPEVVDSVNYIFSSVMSEQTGEVDYTPEEYLINGAEYKKGSDYNTEVIVFDKGDISGTGDTVLDELSNYEAEAQNAAVYIKKLICDGNMYVTDKESGELRRARFGDVAVLCRGIKGCNIIEAALSEHGIMSVSNTGQSYLSSIEVTTVLSFLQIIDNPLQDIPLIAVMRSPMFGFRADDLAKIRACARGRFFTAVLAAAENNEKAARFVTTLSELRRCAKFMGTDELVWKICNELHYFSIAGSMPDGERRKANLKLLLSRCSDYEQGSLKGLFNFMKYIELLRDNDKDLSPAKSTASNDNEVRIMTIHKSKGLEFPIVFLLGTSKKFLLSDIQRSIIWDERFGIGLDLVDTKQRVRFSVPIRDMIENELLRQLKAEEMRLLYVAMTRAKEKLIISGIVTGRDNKWMSAEFDGNGCLYPAFSKEIMSMRDWVFSALMNEPHSDILRELADRSDIRKRQNINAPFKTDIALPVSVGDEPTAAASAESDKTEKTAENIKERLDYRYPYAELKTLPIKLSVSELKRRKAPDDSFSAGLLKTPTNMITDSGDISAAERGTITHFVLQHMDISRTDSPEQIKEQLDAMTANGIISENQSSAVDTGAIYSFFSGELGRRLKGAEKFEREFDFYMLVPPSEVTGTTVTGADDVILQGIADCFFYEADGAVLIDYKTDRVGKSGIQKRSELYRLQIEYYSRGLEAILGVPIKERYLYFLSCNEAVKM